MSEIEHPAHTRESAVLRLSGAVSLEDLTPSWAWGGSTGAGVRVAVIDSGIDADHSALDNAVDESTSIQFSVDKSGAVMERVGPHRDSFGHATAVSSVIHGLAPDVRLTSVKVFGDDMIGKASAFLQGLAWTIEQRFDVVNLSLGTSKREWALPFYELCDQAYFAGTLVVTAANNSWRTSYPSLYSSVTSVACNLTKDPFRFHYNPEPPTEFLARGVEVDVAWRNQGRIVATGNSYAAPHIAAIAALVKAKHPELRPFQLKTVLWATAANVLEAPRIAGRLSQSLRRATLSARTTAALRSVSAITPPDLPTTPG
jgi:subtilisin family serine protease